MLNKRIINTGGGAACTTDTTQILDAGSTQSEVLYRFEDNVIDTSSSAGKFNKGAIFNGIDTSTGRSKIITSSLPTYNNYSISFWINSNDLASSADIVMGTSDNYSGAVGFGIYTGSPSSGDINWAVCNGSSRVDITASGLSPKQWHHVVITQNTSNNEKKIYVDNTLKATSTSTINNTNVTYSLIIGGYQTYNNSVLNGKLDQIRVFNKVVSASEVTTLYNETTSTVSTLQVLGDYSCIATYTFEGNANDLSTNYNGTASNVRYDYNGTASNVTYATGKFGKAIEFNGSTGFMNVENMSTVLANDFTVSMWVKTPSSLATSGYPTFASLYGYPGSGSAYGWSVEYVGAGASSKITFYWVSSSGVGNYLQSAAISPNTWYHVLVKKDASSASLYINGQLDHSGGSGISSYAMYYNTITDLTFGAKRLTDGGSISSQFTGLVDQVRLFTKQLNVGEISALYNETATSVASGTIDNPSTIAYYKMADGTDETGSYDGTASNVDFNVQGKYGFAGKFNGSSSKITRESLFDNTQVKMSASVWIKATDYSPSSNIAILDIGDNDTVLAQNRIFISGTSPHNIFVSVNGGDGGFAQASQSFTDNSWNHIVATWDVTGGGVTNGIKIYLNGSLAGQGNSTQGFNSARDLALGVNEDQSVGDRHHFSGSIDQVRIFNKAISAAEVTKLYNEVQCANTITTPENYFQTKLYTGTGSAQSITGVGFQPDLAWIKSRSHSTSHELHDSVRGEPSRISSDSSSAAATSLNGFVSLASDGFTVDGTGGGGEVNTNSRTYVAWLWKAASSNVTNNDGTLTSTVSASPESGFSIVRYTGTASYSDTVGHGLTKAPQLIIQKGLSHTVDWYVLINIDGTGAWDWAKLNTNQAYAPDSPTRFSANSKTINNWGWNGYDMINYCFHDAPGYQRIGSYIGNGSANGPFIYTGFEPAWIMIKRTDAAGAWNIFDNKRNSANPRNSILQADVSDLEYTNTNYNTNFYANGFQFLNSTADWNANNGNYIFLAIAANPDTSAPTKANSFKTKLYTGDGNSSKSITGVGFQPDWTWIKNRTSAGENHAAYDSVRGNGYTIYPNLSDAQNTGNLLTLNSDGFTLNTTNNNINNHNYVSWNWKAADHDRSLPSINNDGESSTIVSVNNEAGFGIVKGYVASNGYTATLGHGFNTKPELIIYKPISMSAHWYAYSEYGGSLLGTNNVIKLSGNTAASSDSLFNITNTTFVAGATASAHNFIAYCFRSISGHSKIGTYTISSSSDRTITGFGFTPSWVMVKRTDSTGSWVITDASRLITKEIYADLNNAENTDSNGVQSFDSDGFTVGTGSWLGASGGTYIYMAFK